MSGGKEYLGCLGLLALLALLSGAGAGTVLLLVASKFIGLVILAVVVGGVIALVLRSGDD